MRGIALNFFPLATHHFEITVYHHPFVEGKPPTATDEKAVQRNLEIDGKRDYYWTLFQQTKGGTKAVCKPFNNVYLTMSALRLSLIQSCENSLKSDQIQVVDGFHQRVEITMAKYTEGKQVALLEPYLLRSYGQFGFLVDIRFRPTVEHRNTRRALQLSLSLDKYGRANSNYYADRYSRLVKYVSDFHSRIFPLQLPGGQIVAVKSQLTEVPQAKLNFKNYVVGSGITSRSQFMGVKQNGPLQKCRNDTHLYFLYRQEDRPLAEDLFRALRGDTFKTFPGMESIFQISTLKGRVSGASLSDFNETEIHRIRDQIVKDVGKQVVPIVLTPFSRYDEPESNRAYWHLKHAFLSEDLPIQVVATKTVANKNILKWSAASIGLQIFAKSGGTPWKVHSHTERLIVGIGQAHHMSNGRIDRYFAYSVLTDSSGVFKEVRVLGESQNGDDYIQNFSTNLRNIFTEYSDRFSRFVVHATFAIKRRELESVAKVLSEQQQRSDEGEFVSLKFNDRNRFFGFAIDHNSRVPYESTMISLSKREFLIWFEGLQYGQTSIVRGKIGGPLHVKFTYPTEDEDLVTLQRRSYLQDAINLSGANWRGFNAKSLPVSVYYAQLIARYLKEFKNHGLPAVDVNIITPWFL